VPITETNVQSYEYKLASKGINLRKNIVNMMPDEAIQTQNCFWRNGIVNRRGYEKYVLTEVSTGKTVTGLHRFYFGSSKQLLASAGSVIKYKDGTIWTVIDATIGQSLTDGQKVSFATWGALNKCYIGNGVDGPIKWNGSTASLLNPTDFPTKAIQFLAYQDRLLSLDVNSPGDLTWSASFSDTDAWETVANCGVRPDTNIYGMIIHGSTNVDSGYEAKVLLAGSKGMYLFGGSDLTTGGGGNYTIYELGLSVGCSASSTMKWTPVGTIWLGNDRQIYLLPFFNLTPIPIGNNIKSVYKGYTGIEDISAENIEKAEAVYHDGFYKLSIASKGKTYNDKQFWLDVDRLGKDSTPWYGTMIGRSFSKMFVMNGPGDKGELIAGEGNNNSYVYEADKDEVYNDDGSDIQTRYTTFYNSLGDPAVAKDIDQIELELLSTLKAVFVELLDISGAKETGTEMNQAYWGQVYWGREYWADEPLTREGVILDRTKLSSGVIYWGSQYWGTTYWGNRKPKRVQVPIPKPVQVRRLALTVIHDAGNEPFELYAVRVKVIEKSHIFA
jgi:hypothetical protein